MRSRLLLQVDGDVCLRGRVLGMYHDGWTDGRLTFTVESARDIASFTVHGVIPEWWPAGTSVSVTVNESLAAAMEAVPGRFELECRAALTAGVSTEIRVLTSATVYDSSRERQLGAYVGLVRFNGVPSVLPFRCNVCGATVQDLPSNFDPEASACHACGSNLRLRTLAYLLTDTLFGGGPTIHRLSALDSITGIGVSDSPVFADHVKRALRGYTNTQFDRALVTRRSPFLDIKQPDARFLQSADFVTCSEVLEHVEPPVQIAFDALYSLLRPGGTLILTIPYTLERTSEHFPELCQWHLEHRDGQRMLINCTASGEKQEFLNLRFHGGGQDVLEMRVFGLQDVFTHLEDAGFTDIRVREENVLDQGIFWKYNWGLPITAKRPI